MLIGLLGAWLKRSRHRLPQLNQPQTRKSNSFVLFGGRSDVYPLKTSVRIIDFVDIGHPALALMWDKHQRGYQIMGYGAPASAVNDNMEIDLIPHGAPSVIPKAGMQVGTN